VACFGSEKHGDTNPTASDETADGIGTAEGHLASGFIPEGGSDVNGGEVST